MQSDQYDDKPVFDMHTHTQKFIPEHYKGKKKVEAQVRSMDVWPRLEMLIYVYQYITMEGIVMNASERAHVKLIQIIVASGSCRGFHDGQGKGEILSS